MFGIGFPELVLILVVGLIVFGPGKLPEVARQIGKGLREFRRASAALQQAINEPQEAVKTAVKRQPHPQATSQTQTVAQPAATAQAAPETATTQAAAASTTAQATAAAPTETAAALATTAADQQSATKQ